MADLKLLKELTELKGMSGYEKEVRLYIENELKDLSVEIKKDNLGSIAGISKGDGPKILVAGKLQMESYVNSVNAAGGEGFAFYLNHL